MRVYIVLEAYREHVAEREALGIPPKPLTAEQTAGLVELLKNPPAGEEETLVYLLENRIPPGVDEAAYVKAAFLSAIAQGEATSPLVSREYAVKLLGMMQGGYNIETLVELLDDSALAELAGERLLDDERYAGALVRQLASRGQGPSRIRQQLTEAGICAEQASRALDEGPDWHALAREGRLRKFGAEPPADWPSRARQMRFLQYRGFSNDHIGTCLDDAPGVPDSDS